MLFVLLCNLVLVRAASRPLYTAWEDLRAHSRTLANQEHTSFLFRDWAHSPAEFSCDESRTCGVYTWQRHKLDRNELSALTKGWSLGFPFTCGISGDFQMAWVLNARIENFEYMPFWYGLVTHRMNLSTNWHWSTQKLDDAFCILFVDIGVVMERMLRIIKFIKNIVLAVQVIKFVRRGHDYHRNSNGWETYNGFVCLDESDGRHATTTDLRGFESLD